MIRYWRFTIYWRAGRWDYGCSEFVFEALIHYGSEQKKTRNHALCHKLGSEWAQRAVQSKQTSEWCQRTDERVALYFYVVSWVFWTAVLSVPGQRVKEAFEAVISLVCVAPLLSMRITTSCNLLIFCPISFSASNLRQGSRSASQPLASPSCHRRC